MNNYYLKRKKHLFRIYHRMNRYATKILSNYYPETMVREIMDQTLMECEHILLKLPFIGKRHVFQPVIDVNGWIVALYRAMNSKNIETKIVVYVARASFVKLFDAIPRWLRPIIGKMAFSPLGVHYFIHQGNRSMKRAYPSDFRFKVAFKKEHNKSKSATFTFTECAVHKLYRDLDAKELSNYCNFCDPIYAKVFRMGCDANHTFAQGCTTCTLSFNNQRKTETPNNIRTLIKEAKILLEEEKEKYKSD